MSETTLRESFGREICERAIAEERCAEMFDCLFDGGSATVDAQTGQLVLVSADALAAMVPAEDEDPSPAPSALPARYRKRPVEVVAVRWSGSNWPEVAGFVASVDSPSIPGLAVRQLDNGRLALWIEKSNTWRPDLPQGDWIIAERDGVGLYPCTAEQFADTYEPVEEDGPDD